MLAYAIYYVTVVNVTDDYSFLTLGVITGATAVSVIGMHEWFRHQYGKDRVENPIEEYGGAIAVLMGALSAVWLSRFAVFYAGPEKGWIEYQDGEVWMPVWLSALQTAAILVVMEVSTRSIRRHSLGTLPRTVVVLAPLAVVFSGIKIWLEYSRGELEEFITISVVLLTGSAILYSLRLDRAVLYLLASGAAVGLPIFMALSNWETEHAGLLVPAVVMVGITATDRSLSKRMIENGSGAVVATILFCQIIAADGTEFLIAGQPVSSQPFGLTFWLWVALLVGWFAPTTMQRTPAMPVGLSSRTGTAQRRGSIGCMVRGPVRIRLPRDTPSGEGLGSQSHLCRHGGLMDSFLVHRGWTNRWQPYRNWRILSWGHRWPYPSPVPSSSGSGGMGPIKGEAQVLRGPLGSPLASFLQRGAHRGGRPSLCGNNLRSITLSTEPFP